VKYSHLRERVQQQHGVAPGGVDLLPGHSLRGGAPQPEAADGAEGVGVPYVEDVIPHARPPQRLQLRVRRLDLYNQMSVSSANKSWTSLKVARPGTAPPTVDSSDAVACVRPSIWPAVMCRSSGRDGALVKALRGGGWRAVAGEACRSMESSRGGGAGARLGEGGVALLEVRAQLQAQVVEGVPVALLPRRHLPRRLLHTRNFRMTTDMPELSTWYWQYRQAAVTAAATAASMRCRSQISVGHQGPGQTQQHNRQGCQKQGAALVFQRENISRVRCSTCRPDSSRSASATSASSCSARSLQQ